MSNDMAEKEEEIEMNYFQENEMCEIFAGYLQNRFGLHRVSSSTYLDTEHFNPLVENGYITQTGRQTFTVNGCRNKEVEMTEKGVKIMATYIAESEDCSALNIAQWSPIHKAAAYGLFKIELTPGGLKKRPTEKWERFMEEIGLTPTI